MYKHLVCTEDWTSSALSLGSIRHARLGCPKALLSSAIIKKSPKNTLPLLQLLGNRSIFPLLLTVRVKKELMQMPNC
jgi:hypothetical protein